MKSVNPIAQRVYHCMLALFCQKSRAALLCLLLFGSPFIFTTQAQVVGTFTINSAQATDGTNFQSFTDAVNSLSNGVSGPVIFNVAPGSGPYNERIYIDHRIGTTAANTVTFNCNGVTLTFLSKVNDQHAGVLLDSADYVTFDGLVVVPQATKLDEYGFGFHLVHDADHNTIRKCRIENKRNKYRSQNNDNIIINGNKAEGGFNGNSYCDSNLIIENVIIGGASGITLSSNRAPTETESWMKGNQVISNTISDIDNAGVLVNGYTTGTLVDGNEVTAPNADRTKGIVVQNRNESCMISRNRIHGFVNINLMPITGIYIASNASSGKEIVVANNIIYGYESDDEQNGILLQFASYVKIIHNTIVLNDITTAYYYSRGIVLGFNVQRIQIYNNNISITRQSLDQNYALYLEGRIPHLECNYNNLYVAAPTASLNAVGLANGKPLLTLADWQNETGLDLHSAAFDPLFTDAANNNFRPTQTGIDNMAVPYNVGTDFTGAARSITSPDPGAYEFVTSNCSAPVAGTVRVYPGTAICESNPATLIVDGFSSGVGQTYQWQTDTDINGTFGTLISSPLAAPNFDIAPTSTLYYRLAVTCGATTVYTTPVQISTDATLAAGTYTIDSLRPTGGTNFRSFADALSAMHCGIRGSVVFEVAPGNYNLQLTFPKYYGLSPSKTITFNGNGANLIYTPTNSADRAVVKFDGANFITIDSFNIIIPDTADDLFGFGVQLINDANHNTIRRCSISLNKTSLLKSYACIVISPAADEADGRLNGNYCDSNTVINNTLTGGYYGATCTSFDDDNLPDGNAFINNRFVDNYAYGVLLAGGLNTKIEGNDISRPTRNNSELLYIGIYLTTDNRGTAISKNKIHALSDGDKNAMTQILGIFADESIGTAAAPNIVSNNLMYDFSGMGLSNGLYYINSDYTKFYHNTVSLDDSTVNTAEATRGFGVYGITTTGLEFVNNNITIKRTGTGPKYGIYVLPSSTVFRSDYNNIHVVGGYTGGNSSGDYVSLSDWQTGSGQDAHSLSMDPAYKDPANVDFTPNVLAFDRQGTPINITTDVLNKLRSRLRPDIGAFEFYLCPTFPVVRVAADSQTVCTDNPVTFSVVQPDTLTDYTWYLTDTGGVAFDTAMTQTIDNVDSVFVYWIGARTDEGCVSKERARVTVAHLPPIPRAPVLEMDSVGKFTLRFKWEAVPGALAYQVSRDGVQFSDPSSGPTGLTHQIDGLRQGDTVGLYVKAVANIECQSKLSERLELSTLDRDYFVPNTFTPNGNGQNDVFKVYSRVVVSGEMQIFNQWGQKIFESSNPPFEWDGTYKGRPQPTGVYVYAVRVVVKDGTVLYQRGTINLVR